MPRKTAHVTLDELRQAAAQERVRARDLETKLEAAKLVVDVISQQITSAYVAEDAKRAQQRRKQLEAAEAKVIDLGHRVAAAGQRVEGAQRAVDAFVSDRAKELLAERDELARAITNELTQSVLKTLRLARAYRDERQEIDRLVAAVPGATVKTDSALWSGPCASAPTSHPLSHAGWGCSTATARTRCIGGCARTDGRGLPEPRSNAGPL
jgi:hypothetical protein